MAFVAPSAEDFLDRYPEFIDNDPDQISRILRLAVAEVGEHWIEKDRVPAILAWTAYRLEQTALSTRQRRFITAGGMAAGPVVSESAGSLSVTYQSNFLSGSAGSLASQSVYLSEFDLLRKRNFPEIAIV